MTAALVLTAELLYRSIHELSRERAAELLAPVRLMLHEADAETPERTAMMLAQVAHESCGLTVCVEQDSGAAYEGRVDLGNLRHGDGVRYKGRGWIQLTGRANYHDAGLALGLPLEDLPDLAAQVEVAARVAAWYWRTHHLNEPTDRGDIEGATRKINGGLNGIDDRRRRWAHARAALEP